MTDVATSLETVCLSDAQSGARVLIAPGRGGMVTRFFVGERPVLFLNEDTLIDRAKNVRGGIPVLFPSPGPLTGDRFSRAGRAGAMKQHGFARQHAWSVSSAGEREATLTLTSDDATHAAFPWKCALTLRYALDGARLRIEQRIENFDVEPMPFAIGFHPYFHVLDRDKALARVPTEATRAFDNVTKRMIALRERPDAMDLTQPEVDLHLVDHGRSSASLLLPDGARLDVSGSNEYRRWVIWTLAGRDFVCLEPWTAPVDALNTGESLVVLSPGASRDLWIEIALAR